MIDPVVLVRQRSAIMGGRRTRTPECHRSMTDKQCSRCESRYLHEKNRTGICYECWSNMSAKQRRAVAGERAASRVVPRAAPETIERARAKLKTRGFHVEAT